MFDLLFRKRRLRRELEALRKAIEAKRAEVAEAEANCRKAWGKKWSYIQMQRRKRGSAQRSTARFDEMDGQAEVLEVRRQQYLAELRAREQELETLLATERRVATELGDKPVAASEVDGEEHRSS